MMTRGIYFGALLEKQNATEGIITILFNFGLCMIMAFIVRSFYVNRSFSLTGKNHIGAILPILSGIVFVVIVIVKSSLALSLGLVGALSIVRFRTPIKEPEELIYLFFAIVLGLGYGANQTLVTTVLSILILIITQFWLTNPKLKSINEFNLLINWSDKGISLDELAVCIEPEVESMKVIRADFGEQENSVMLLTEPKSTSSLNALVRQLQEKSSSLSCSFFEANTNW